MNHKSLLKAQKDCLLPGQDWAGGGKKKPTRVKLLYYEDKWTNMVRVEGCGSARKEQEHSE